MSLPAWLPPGADIPCATVDLDVFYDASRAESAKDICQACPLIAECLEWALETRDGWAVLGGMTAVERRSVLRKRQRADAKEPAPDAPFCKAGCGRRVISRHSVLTGERVPPGHARHGGRGMCDACHQRLIVRPNMKARRNADVDPGRVVADYTRGLSLRDVRRMHGIGDAKARRILAEHGVPLRDHAGREVTA